MASIINIYAGLLKKDGSNYSTKYTSQYYLVPSCSSAAVLITAWEYHSIPAALPEHLCSIPKAPRSAKMTAIPIAVSNGHIYPITLL